MSGTTLYRLKGQDKRLLYVGVAGNPGRRFEQHRREKSWWNEVAFAEMEHFDERVAALSAESSAIRAEKPAYNIAQNNRREVAEPRSGVPSVSPRHVRYLKNLLEWRCLDCDRWVSHLTSRPYGQVSVDCDEMTEAMSRMWDWKNAHPDGVSVEVGALLELPKVVKWKPRCRKCSDQVTDWYAIDTPRFRSLSHVLEWTAHLAEKEWVNELTNWPGLLRTLSFLVSGRA